jgi:hypothetical protein
MENKTHLRSKDVKIDFKKELNHLYNSSVKEFKIVDVPEMNFLMLDGTGDPNTAQEYKDAVESIYAVSYTLKFMFKRGTSAIDYGVMPLEGLWWTDDMSQFSELNKDIWKFTSMIMQPRYVDRDMFDEAFEQVKKERSLPALSKISFASFHEGLAAQIMYIGQYSAEGPTIKRLHGYIAENGYELTGKHHEIYLGDPRRSAPEKLKTIIRQPMKAR